MWTNYKDRQARLDEDFEATLQLGNTDYSTAVALLTVGFVKALRQQGYNPFY